MPRDGSGNYSLSGAAFVSGTVIDASAVNTKFSDIASALTQSFSVDGQAPATANWSLANYQITNLGAGTMRTHAAQIAQVQDASLTWGGSTGGTASSLTATLSPPITSSYADGQVVRVRMSTAAGSGATLNVGGGSKTIKTWKAGALTPLASNDLGAGVAAEFTYTSVEDAWQLTTPISAISGWVEIARSESSSTVADVQFLLPSEYKTFALDIQALRRNLPSFGYLRFSTNSAANFCSTTNYFRSLGTENVASAVLGVGFETTNVGSNGACSSMIIFTDLDNKTHGYFQTSQTTPTAIQNVNGAFIVAPDIGTANAVQIILSAGATMNYHRIRLLGSY